MVSKTLIPKASGFSNGIENHQNPGTNVANSLQSLDANKTQTYRAVSREKLRSVAKKSTLCKAGSKQMLQRTSTNTYITGIPV